MGAKTNRCLITIALLLGTGFLANFAGGIRLREGVQFAFARVPFAFGQWHGTDEAVSEVERNLWASADSRVMRRRYRRGLTRDGLAWLVLVQGPGDLRNLHPPERCYTAQGWRIAASERHRGAEVRQYRVLVVERPRQTEGGQARQTEGGQARQTDGGQGIRQYRRVIYWYFDGRHVAAGLMGRTVSAVLTRMARGISPTWVLVRLSVPARGPHDLSPGQEMELARPLMDTLTELLAPQW